MMETFVMRHLPALLIATPLFAAFLMPLIGGAGRTVRSAWVFLGAALTAAVGLALAWQVFTTGTVFYVFGAANPQQSLPADAAFPIRIMFQVDALSALMIVIASLSSLAITVYSLAAESKQSGLETFYAMLFLLVTGVLGMVSTGDLFNFFVFLEISSLAGAALVAYRVDNGVAVEAGL